MKLFVINSCFLVLLMAALGKASVLDSGLEDDERIQLRWDCTGEGTTCPDPCGPTGPGGICHNSWCCHGACLIGTTPVTCVKGSSCLANDCGTAPGDRCCTPCVLNPDNCKDKCGATCGNTQSCTCIAGVPGTSPNACGCTQTCDPTACTFANGKCGTGASAKTCVGSTTCQCTAGVCRCGPCDTAKCNTDCNPGNGDLGGSCASGTCVCNKPPCTPTPCTPTGCTNGCNTGITFNVQTCGGTSDIPCP